MTSRSQPPQRPTAGRDRVRPLPGPATLRRHLLASALLALALLVALPAVNATGRYSADQLLTFYGLIMLALAGHLAEWWDSRVTTSGEAGDDRLEPVSRAQPATRRTALEGATVSARTLLARRPPADDAGGGGGGGTFAARIRFGWPARVPGERPLPFLPLSASDLVRVMLLVLAILFLLLGLVEVLGGVAGQDTTTSNGSHLSASDQLIGGALQTAAGAICLLVFLTGTRWLPGLRHLREDRPISWLAILVVTESLATLLAPASGTQSVASTIAHPTTAADLIAGSLPFGVIAVLAVGPIVDRTPRQWAQRLGFLPLRPSWWVVGIAVGVLLVPAVDWIFTPLQSYLLPSDCAVQQQQVQQSLAGGDTGRGVLASIAIALAAGTDEELLFRGVLLPRFGLVWSSFVFGAFHLQYTCHGLPSVGDLEIVVLGFAFGILRLRGGVVAAILAHAAYDGSILLGDIAPGVSALLFVPMVAWLVRDEIHRRRARNLGVESGADGEANQAVEPPRPRRSREGRPR